MKLFSRKDIQQWDEVTLKEQNVSDIELIKRASNAFVEELFSTTELILKSSHKKESPQKFLFVCGKGNNGADGFCVSNILAKKGFDINIWSIDFPGGRSESNKKLKEQLSPQIKTVNITEFQDLPLIDEDVIIIDAVLGSGIQGKIRENYSDLFFKINSLPNTVVSVDVPSGMSVEMIKTEIAIESDLCLTFEAPKMSFFLEDNSQYIHNWRIVNINLDKNFYRSKDAQHIFYNHTEATNDLKSRSQTSHKGSYGHLLMCAGSRGMIGSALLAGKASLRAGCGLTTIHASQCAYDIIQTSLVEAMVSIDPNHDTLSELPDLSPYDVIAIGPGLGQKPKTKKFLLEILEKAEQHVILDADALNILSSVPNWKRKIKKNHILLPHPGEFDRLCGKSSSHSERVQKLTELSKDIPASIILKGHYTMVVQENKPLSINSTGNSGMSTAGSGDVLTGIIASLVAQAYESYQACKLGVYLHGLAGDVYAEKFAEESLIARDLIEMLPFAFKRTKLKEQI